MRRQRLPQQARLERSRRPHQSAARATASIRATPSKLSPQRVRRRPASPTHCCPRLRAVQHHLAARVWCAQARGQVARQSLTPQLGEHVHRRARRGRQRQRARRVEPLEPRVAQPGQAARPEAPRRAVDRGDVDRIGADRGRRSAPPARPRRPARAGWSHAPARLDQAPGLPHQRGDGQEPPARDREARRPCGTATVQARPRTCAQQPAHAPPAAPARRRRPSARTSA